MQKAEAEPLRVLPLLCSENQPWLAATLAFGLTALLPGTHRATNLGIFTALPAPKAGARVCGKAGGSATRGVTSCPPCTRRLDTAHSCGRGQQTPAASMTP